MKAAKISYHRANTLEDAIALATRLGGTSKYLAGGQSLLPMMNLRLTLSEAVIDLSAIPALRESKAVWKVIAADMPIGLLVPDGRDSQGRTRFEAIANGDGPPLGRELETARLLGVRVAEFAGKA